MLTQTSPGQLSTSPGDWVGNLAEMHSKRAWPGTEILQLGLEKCTQHTDTHTHADMHTNSCAGLCSAVRKLLCLSEDHKEPLVVEVSLRSQWKTAAPPTAQVIIPEL